MRAPLPTRLDRLPDLPAGFGRAIDVGVDALGISLPAAARSAIESHARLLLAWTAAINLTAIRDAEAIARLHVIDSLSALALLERAGTDGFVDLGSGGGYPGIPLAAALPGARALLVDSVGKKATFLRVVVEAVDLADRVTVAADRAEALAAQAPHREHWPCVTARAVADLADLVELSFPLLVPGGRLIAWKRGDAVQPGGQELEAARRAVAALGGGEIVMDRAPEAAGLAGHVLVVAEKRDRTPGAYPRDPTRRRRQPW